MRSLPCHDSQNATSLSIAIVAEAMSRVEIEIKIERAFSSGISRVRKDILIVRGHPPSQFFM